MPGFPNCCKLFMVASTSLLYICMVVGFGCHWKIATILLESCSTPSFICNIWHMGNKVGKSISIAYKYLSVTASLMIQHTFFLNCITTHCQLYVQANYSHEGHKTGHIWRTTNIDTCLWLPCGRSQIHPYNPKTLCLKKPTIYDIPMLHQQRTKLFI